MRRIKILRKILRRTGAHRIRTGFLVFFFLCAVVVWLREPGIATLGDAIWYCYAVVTTIGFGDVTVSSHLSRVLSILLSIYAALVIAVVTGVVVNYYNELTRLRRKSSMVDLLDQLERLPELSREELAQISARVREFSGRK